MLFNSFEFLVFFLVVTILFFLLPHRFRWLHLLLASCYFYMAFVPVYILILFFTIIIDYIAGIMIEGAAGGRRKWFLVMSVIANVGILAYFKYYNFFIDNLNDAFHLQLPFLKILLPIGLSFHTFQAMSYTIEVYRGNQKAERHFGIYALYVMFYPQLVAGPIERPQNILHQFHEKKYLSYNNVISGLRLMLWGMFKKVVIADRLASYSDNIFNNPGNYSAIGIATAVVFFAFQIYCDFSGYSDIAIGCARVMGFKLMINFNTPFHSTSITEFWRRWHISLSTWFNDYVFKPFVTTYRDRGDAAIIFGLLLTFFLSGFWHGAGWNFIIYGLLHGLVIGYEYLTRKQRKKLFKKLPAPPLNAVLRILTVGFVAFTWIFFRAANTSVAFFMIRKLGGVFSECIDVLMHGHLVLVKYISGIPLYNIFRALALIIFLMAVESYNRRKPVVALLERQPRFVRWGVYYLFVFAIIYTGVFDNRQFIYFQF